MRQRAPVRHSGLQRLSLRGDKAGLRRAGNHARTALHKRGVLLKEDHLICDGRNQGLHYAVGGGHALAQRCSHTRLPRGQVRNVAVVVGGSRIRRGRLGQLQQLGVALARERTPCRRAPPPNHHHHHHRTRVSKQPTASSTYAALHTHTSPSRCATCSAVMTVFWLATSSWVHRSRAWSRRR